MQPQPKPASQGQADYKGARVNAKTAQRPDGEGKPGDYVCQMCQTQFHYEIAEGAVECPKCHTKAAEALTPTYTEEDPRSDEMLGRDEFSAGD